MMYKQDIILACENCHRQFEWTGGEQAFIERLLMEGKIKEINQPKRCPACRLEKKKRFEQIKSNETDDWSDQPR